MESFAEIKRIMFEVETPDSSRPHLCEPCIMIIDDDLDVADALRTLLQPHFRLVACFSFEEARQNLTPAIRIILLDIKMAGKDGIEAFTLLKEERGDLSIIFHSAYPGSSERGVALERLSHHGYLTKGEYDLPELLTTIEQAMNEAG